MTPLALCRETLTYRSRLLSEKPGYACLPSVYASRLWRETLPRALAHHRTDSPTKNSGSKNWVLIPKETSCSSYIVTVDDFLCIVETEETENEKDKPLDAHNFHIEVLFLGERTHK
ncbi:hypothetical protein [Chlorogloeopsis sp. ULAP02]|uniref:hypothetical protein n=1 Tax=Chlorogloeopsis sp. ULAP02 TaxID=3107926 RepID=UPI003135DECE